jgi:HK97 family phage prohead protease
MQKKEKKMAKNNKIADEVKKEFEQRAYTFEIRAEEKDGEGIITGRPIVYNQRTDIGGWFEEVIDSGALDGADLTDVRFLVNHDMRKIPLARSRRNNGNSTMQFSIDPEGMLLDWVKLDIKSNPEAAALYSAVSRGDITGMSFCFSVKGEKWDNLDTDYPTRHITEIGKVDEVSAVTFPAYEATTINARGKDALESAWSAVETARQAEAAKVETEALELAKAKYFYKNH